MIKLSKSYQAAYHILVDTAMTEKGMDRRSAEIFALNSVKNTMAYEKQMRKQGIKLGRP